MIRHGKERSTAARRRLPVFIAVALAVAALLRPAPASAARLHLTLNSGHNPPLATDDHTGFQDLVEIEAYRRAGVDVSIIRLPTERSGINANAGIEAGNGPRIAAYGKLYPNLIRIPEKTIDFDFVGFTLNPNIVAHAWKDLAPYTVGIVTGWKILEAHVITAAQVIKVPTIRLLFRLLRNHRADIVIIERWQGLFEARKLGLEDVKVLDPPFASRPMFFYLNKTYAPLVPKVAAALKSMKADGTYKAFYLRTLAPFVAKH